jgi:hypothetical protein
MRLLLPPALSVNRDMKDDEDEDLWEGDEMCQLVIPSRDGGEETMRTAKGGAAVLHLMRNESVRGGGGGAVTLWQSDNRARSTTPYLASHMAAIMSSLLVCT